MSWERVPPPKIHICKLPDLKDFEVGERVRCTKKIVIGNGKKTAECGLIWRVGLTWFWRDKKWRCV